MRKFDSAGKCNVVYAQYHPSIEIMCGNLTVPENGRLTLSDGTLFGSKAAYSCFIGYILNGTNVRLCTANGTWNDTDPSCIGIA